ncbi:MAG: ribonuclease P protein component [Lachnospiraceae bacterium]|nr:ribonuclease P protein component [Lachnospiraceae bacterium]
MKFSESLKKNVDFQNVYKNGKSYANRLFVMYVLENHSEKNRLGISVSKKVGNSVIRHHITRLVREAYRLQEEMFYHGLDIVVIARAAAKNVTYHETEKALMHLGGIHRILIRKEDRDFEKNINCFH